MEVVVVVEVLVVLVIVVVDAAVIVVINQIIFWLLNRKCIGYNTKPHILKIENFKIFIVTYFENLNV